MKYSGVSRNNHNALNQKFVNALEVDTIEEYKQALEEQMAVVSGLAKDYYSVMLVDYREDTFMIREARGEDGKQIADFFSQYPSWSAGIKSYMETRVVESEKENFYKAMSLQGFRNAMGDYTVNYQKVIGSTIKHLQVKVTYVISKNGRRLAVVGTRNVEKEFQDRIKLQEANDKLQQNLNIIGSVSTFFAVIYYVDLRDYSFVEVRAPEYETIGGICRSSSSATEAFRRVKEEVILEAHRNNFALFTDLRTLDYRLRFRKCISQQFEGMDAGWFEGSFIAADRDEDGKCTHVLWTVRSVQEQKERELEHQQAIEAAKTKAENANKAKTSFLFNMSHDIRTPMNAIIGFTGLATTHIKETELVKRYLQKIMISSQHLLSLINDVLDMSRIESGHVTIKPVECSLPVVLCDLQSILQSDIKEKNLSFCIETVGVEHENLFFDKLKLNQVLLNLLGNAMKFTPIGGTVGLKVIEEKGAPEGFADFKFIVSDTGIGMSKEFMEHLFEPFVREESSTVSGIQGTGLGLAITKNIINMMGGNIDVKSEKNKGSKFTIGLRFRISVNKKEDKQTDTQTTTADVEFLKGKRVLLVEDVELNREIAIAIMEDKGIVVDAVENGKLGVDRIKEAEPGYYDLVCMDVMMPVMDGYTATKAIRQLDNHCKANVPVIAMTANAFEEDREKAWECGMNGFISKPFKVDQLFKLMKNQIR